MTIQPQCISPTCERPLYSRVTYCPFCGSSQQSLAPAIAVIEVPQTDVLLQDVPPAVTDAPPAVPSLDSDLSTQTKDTEPLPTKKKHWAAKHWWMFSVVLVPLIAVAFYLFKPIDSSQCDTPSHNILVILDFTGQPSLATSEIINRIQLLFERTVSGDRFAIFDTRADRPIFEVCRSPLSFATREDTKRQLTQIVSSALSAIEVSSPESLPQLAKSRRQKISRKITDLSLTSYMRADKNSLHLVSDLLEDNPAAFERLCEPMARATQNFRAERRGGMEQPEFLNTHVYLHLVPRQDINAQSLNCRDKYWRWLLANTSGSSAGLSIEYLPSSTRSSNE